MSNFLYRTRLFWEGYRGTLKADGVLVELNTCPQILPGVRIVAIEFCPEVHVATVQPYAEPHRDLTPSEITLCRATLERVALAARIALDESCQTAA